MDSTTGFFSIHFGITHILLSSKRRVFHLLIFCYVSERPKYLSLFYIAILAVFKYIHFTAFVYIYIPPNRPQASFATLISAPL